MKKEIYTHSEQETLQWAENFAKSLEKGAVVALSGELGSGKTIIAKGIARGVGIDDDITSPTFTLLEVYGGAIPLYHFDLYRIESAAEFTCLGFEEYWEGDGISVVEWAERAKGLLPECAIQVTIEYITATQRKITIEYPCN